MIYQPQMNINTNEEGQGLVEYALILVLVAVVVIVVLTALGGQVTDVFQSISDSLAGGLANDPSAP